MKTRQALLVLMAIFVLASCNQQSPMTPSAPHQDLSSGRTEQSSVKNVSTIDGIITDSMCGLNHAGMLKTGSMGNTDASCVVKCVEAGSQYVLADPSTGDLYRLSNQGGAKPFAGKRVKITGQIHKESKLIEVQSYLPAP